MKFIRCILFLFPFFCSAQTTKYFVSFTDKNNSPFSISNPTSFLSQRAIDRRTIKGVAIEENDLPVNPAYVDSVSSRGAIVFTRSKWFNGVTIQADSATRVSVMSLPFVQQVTSVNRLRSNAEERITRNKFKMPLGNGASYPPRIQSYSYGQSYTQIQIMNGDYLHDAGFHGEHVIIAILDAGFYHANSLPAFDSIFANNQVIGTWDFVANEASVYEDYEHGMEVLSTIGGNVPGQLVGTAPKASFLLLRTEDVFTEHRIEEYNWDAAAEFADSAGADIITTSLGYAQNFTNPLENHTYSEMNGHTTVCAMAANIAFSKGMLVIASAGNSGAIGDPWLYIGTPADADSALAIGAIDMGGNRAFFSSRGPSADGDIKPNLAAVGQGSILSTTTGPIGSGNGTSFACPILAGSAACLWQAFPNKTNSEIFDAIQRSASQYHSPDSLLGYGIPNFMLADQLLSVTELTAPGNDNLLSVFPNPFKDDVSINFYSASNEELTLEIFDTPGRNLFHKNYQAESRIFNSISLPVSDFKKGIYFIKISTPKNQYIRKVVKL